MGWFGHGNLLTGCKQKGGSTMAMQRWNPFEDMIPVEDRMKRFWNRMPFWPQWAGNTEGDWTVPFDVRVNDDAVVVEASLPGISPEEVTVEIEDGVLTVKGETKTENEEKKEGYVLKERSQGAFYRSVRLPQAVDEENATSTYKDGVLTISLPRKAESKPKRIKLDVA